MKVRTGWLILLAAAIAFVAGTTEAREARKPNVLLILADDLGFSDLGCYGGEIATPNLDGLAANGVRFTQAYNTGRCWPTRAAILTGYYAQQVRRDTSPSVPNGNRGVRPKWAALAPALLRPQGYRSYFSGKWHVDGEPLANGFDRSYQLVDQGRFFNPRQVTEDDRPLPKVRPGYYATIGVADHAIRTLTDHAANHADQPFFHYLCFTAPHFPLHALPEDIAHYRDRYLSGWEALRKERHERMRKMDLVSHDLPATETEVGPPYHFPEALKTLGPLEVNRPLPWESLTSEQRRFQATKMAIHAAMVDRMDREIGRVVDQLRSMNALENTLILFLSDNGASAEMMVRDDGHDPQAEPGSAKTHLSLGPGWSGAANTPLRRHKTWVHEGGISTPLIAHWPGGIRARGELRRTPTHVIDLLPTLLDLAGVEAPATWDGLSRPSLPGRSLRPLLNRDAGAGDRELWWSHEGNRAIRVGNWKLVAAGKDAPWELYDLKRDRGETNNLAERQPERVRELAELWKRRWDENGITAKEGG